MDTGYAMLPVSSVQRPTQALNLFWPTSSQMTSRSTLSGAAEGNTRLLTFHPADPCPIRLSAPLPATEQSRLIGSKRTYCGRICWVLDVKWDRDIAFCLSLASSKSAHLARCIECAEASGLERYQNIFVATEDLSHYFLSLAVICFSNVMKITFTAAESHLRLQRNPSKQVASVRLARLRPEEKTQETLRLWGFGFFSHSTFAEKEIFQRCAGNKEK